MVYMLFFCVFFTRWKRGTDQIWVYPTCIPNCFGDIVTLGPTILGGASKRLLTGEHQHWTYHRDPSMVLEDGTAPSADEASYIIHISEAMRRCKSSSHQWRTISYSDLSFWRLQELDSRWSSLVCKS
jgi:hypothetical protein